MLRHVSFKLRDKIRQRLRKEDCYNLVMEKVQFTMNDEWSVLDRVRRWRGPVYGQFDMEFDDGLDNENR